MNIATDDHTAAAAVAAESDPALRGVLVIRERAAQHVIERVLGERASVRHPKVHVTSFADDGVEADIEFTLEYPTRPLSDILDEVRTHLAGEAGRQLGRPLRRIRLTISEFDSEPSRRPRRVV
jgi:hypothetical protein